MHDLLDTHLSSCWLDVHFNEANGAELCLRRFINELNQNTSLAHVRYFKLLEDIEYHASEKFSSSIAYEISQSVEDAIRILNITLYKNPSEYFTI